MAGRPGPTGQEFAKAKTPYPAHADQTYPRQPWFARRDADAYGVVLDERGKIAWGLFGHRWRPIVVVLTEQVSDAHLAGLRQDGVSYFFAGKTELDPKLALETLHGELGVKRLLLEGGGAANGTFLRAGLIDEISIAVCPTVDGAKGARACLTRRNGIVSYARRWRGCHSKARKCWTEAQSGCATGSATTLQTAFEIINL